MGSCFPLLPNPFGFQAHVSGALWIAESATAIIADVHLGYSWAQRRRGELGPLADAGTRAKLFRIVADLKPLRIVFLGDLVHAPRPCAPERQFIEATLEELSRHAELISVRGNHDRAFARDFAHLPVRTVEHWSEQNVYAIHGDVLPRDMHADVTLVMGHLHPALPILDASGAGRKLPVFLASERCIVLPAFSPFAGGYDLLAGLPAALAGCDFHAHAVTATRVVPLGVLQDARRPAEFRRRHFRNRA